jgi:hypothetical protein
MSKVLEIQFDSAGVFRGPSSLLVDSLDLTNEPHPRFPVHGHIRMSVGGDALMS